MSKAEEVVDILTDGPVIVPGQRFFWWKDKRRPEIREKEWKRLTNRLRTNGSVGGLQFLRFRAGSCYRCDTEMYQIDVAVWLPPSGEFPASIKIEERVVCRGCGWNQVT